MPKKEVKSSRCTFRLHPSLLQRLHDIADDFNTSIADLLVTGALSLAIRAQGPGGFYKAKSEYLSRDTHEYEG